MDQLSEKLNASNIMGDIGDKLINHLCYADDICLISLSSVGMQQLLSICDIYAKEHDLLYNGGNLIHYVLNLNGLHLIALLLL